MSQGLLEHRSPDATIRLHGGAALEVFLHMLLSADGNGEFTLESARTMSKRLGLSERTVFRALKRLEAEGYITTLDEVQTNYRSAMRRINPVEKWPAPTPNATQRKRERDRRRMAEKRGSDNCGQNEATSPENGSSRSDLSYISKPITTNYKSFLHTSYVEPPTPTMWAMPILGLVSAEGNNTMARKFVDPEDAFDPWAAGMDEPPPPAPESPEAREARITAEQRRIAAKRKNPKTYVGPAQFEAERFRARAVDAGVIGSTNVAALSSHFFRWVKQEGATYEQIRDLVRDYWADDFPRSRTVPAWRDFLSRKEEVQAFHSDAALLASGEDVFAGINWN